MVRKYQKVIPESTIVMVRKYQKWRGKIRWIIWKGS